MVICRACTLDHAAQISRRRIMASNAGCLHRTVTRHPHSPIGKGCCTDVTYGALITRHTCREKRRNMIGGLRHDIGISSAMAGLADCADPGMVKGRWQPVDKTVVAGLASCRRRQVVGRLDVDIGVSTAMTIAAARRGDTGMRIRGNQRQPGNPGPVAVLAGLGCRDMRSRFAACVDIVVTSCAGTGHNSDVGKTGWLPERGRMANVTGLSRRYMGHILGLGIGGNVGTIMAARAVAGCRWSGCQGMTHNRRGKRRVILVTSVTLRRCGYMVGRLAKRIGTVMAGRAAPGCSRNCCGVIINTCRPGYGRVVAGIALSRRRNMSGRFGLRVLGEIGATVAGRTLAGQSGMVHHRRRPGCIAASMAGIAPGSRRDMRGRLGQRIHRNVITVVARRAISHCNRSRCPGMTHHGGPEGIVVVMAGRTLCSGRNVIGRFTQCSHAIMARRTYSDRSSLMDIGDSSPGHRCRMTGVALRGGGDVGRRLDLGIDRHVSPCMAG